MEKVAFNIKKLWGGVGFKIPVSFKLSWFQLPENLLLLSRDVQNFHMETLNQEMLI